MLIDATTDLGRVRLIIGDWQDLPLLPDSVISQTLTDCANNVRLTAIRCAQYILVSLSFKSHKKLAQLETWSNQQYEQYRDYLTMVVSNPNFNGQCPIPYSGSGTDTHPLIEFTQDWQANTVGLTQSQQLAIDAKLNPFFTVEETV